MTGQLPFGNGLRAVAKILEANPPEFPSFLFANAQFAPLAEELKSVVLNCLQKEPLARPTADDLVSNISEFCYPISERYTGTVREIKHRSWGFIESQGRDVFFHLSSVYGKPPVVGSHVVFSKFIGGGAQRAHPVIVSQNG
jgi:serine/threonine-protein kinase